MYMCVCVNGTEEADRENRNKHIQVDFGTGNNNKLNFKLNGTQELIDIVEAVYRGASKGKGLVVSPKDYSTKWVY